MTVVLVIATGVLAGIGNTALIGVINASLFRPEFSYVQLLLGFIGLCLFIPVSGFISQMLLVRVTANAGYTVRRKLSDQILSARLRKIEELGSHRLFAALADDIPAVMTTISSLPTLFTQVAIVAGCLIYLGWLSRPLLIPVLIYIVFGIAIYQIPFLKALEQFRILRETVDILFKSFRAIIDGNKELKLNKRRRQALVSEQLEPTLEATVRYSVSGSTYSCAAGTLGQFLLFFAIGLVLFLSPRLIGLDRHVLTGYSLTILYMNGPLAAILNTLPNLGRAQVALSKIQTLGISLRDGPLPDSGEIARDVPWRRLELHEVTHKYHVSGQSDSFAVGPITLSFRPGELVFLIGGNGSGKTTLVKMLAGLYAPDSGQMVLDGERITDANRDQYRQHFSAIFSDYFLFDTLLGLESSGLKDKAEFYLGLLELRHKVKIKNGALSCIDLSAGERKRLALLTAYLEDRSFYIFDEWAADQDPIFKRHFYCETLPELKAAGKTVLVISHDDRFYYLADRVIRLENGQLSWDSRPEAVVSMEVLEGVAKDGDGDPGARVRTRMSQA